MDGISMVEMVRRFSERIDDGRTISDVLEHAMEELGELATENKIARGKSYKKPGKDGIVGEALDLINCALDIIYLAEPDLTPDDLIDMQYKKCVKWVEKVEERNSNE